MLTIDSLQAIDVGDSTQWLRIRGSDVSNPVLLLIQQGPGLPVINEVHRFARVLRLEEAFTVVYWDQRGCGLSLRGQKPHSEIRLEKMVSDTVRILEYLRDRFGGKTTIAAFSIGGTIGAFAAARRPDLVQTLITVGMDIHGAAASRNAYDFALAMARQRGHARAIRQLEAVGPPPHLNAKQFSTRVRWLINFGGVVGNETYVSLMHGLLVSLLRSADYSPGDVVRTIRGIGTAQAALLPEIEALNLVHSLPRIDVPVVMVQGRLDQVSPGGEAALYASSLQAPSKQLIWFENSRHSPHLEESEKFRDLLMRARAGQI